MISIIAYIFIASSCMANPTTLRSTQGRYIRDFGSVASRRQAVSYVTNVIHQDPKNPNQMAQSTVNVNFSPSSETNQPIQHYSQSNQQHIQPVPQNSQLNHQHSKTVQKHTQSLHQHSQSTQQHAQPIHHHPESIQQHQYFQRLPHHATTSPSQESTRKQTRQKSRQQPLRVQTAQDIETNQSQLFNVGYSVRFRNNPTVPSTRAPPSSPAPTNHRSLDGGEIITGTRKRNEQVNIPDLNTSPQQLVTSSVPVNRHKYQRPKKYSSTTQAPDAGTVLAQANLSPITQKYFQALQQIQSSSKPETDVVQDQTGWKSLSPSVEIYQSEATVSSKYNLQQESDDASTPSNYDIIRQESSKPRYFDHESALGRSQGFDYTNVINMESNSIQNTPSELSQNLQPQASSQRISTAVHSDPQPPLPQHSLFNNFAIFQPQVPNREVPQLIETTGEQSPIPLFLPPVTKTIDNVQSTGARFPSVPRLPVDTTLIREPVLTTDTKHLPANPNLIPIHFDTRLLQEMQQKLSSYQHPPDHLFGAHSQQSFFAAVPQEPNQYPSPIAAPSQAVHTVYVQNYEPAQLRPAQQEIETKDENFAPSLPAQPFAYATQMQIIHPQPVVKNQQDFRTAGLPVNNASPLNQRTDFKIYGKPQSFGKPIGQENATHHFHKDTAYIQRQPRFRIVEHKLRTNLRPPPVAQQHNYQRRLYRV